MLAAPKIAALAFLVTAWDPTAPVEVPFGFESGNGYLQMAEPQRHAFAMGLFDAFMASTAIGSDVGVVHRIKDCAMGMKSNQVMAILDKYLRDHPEEWHHDMGMMFLRTISQTCPGAVWPAQNLRKP